MFTDEYTVRLEQFEGPMDLLLHLIRRAELDVTMISVASITDQYLKHLEHIERVDVEVAGEFLVIAATLLELKSRLVSPDPEKAATLENAVAEESDDSNPAADLIRQLLAYKAYRDAADALDQRREQWAKRYPAGEAATDAEAMDSFLQTVNDLDIEDLEIYDLVEAFQRIIETVQFDRLGSHNVTFDDTPQELHAADIIDRLTTAAKSETGSGGLSLRAVFTGRTRSEMIGLFLATLEMVRQRRVRVMQDEATGEVVLSLGEEVADAAAVAAAPAAPAG